MGIDPDRTFTVKEIIGAVDRIFERPETTKEQRVALGQLVPELLGIKVPAAMAEPRKALVPGGYSDLSEDEDMTHNAFGERIR